MDFEDYDPEEADKLGKAIYREKILPLLDRQAYKGKIVVIDIKSGDYEIDDDSTASERLRKRRPNAFTTAERVGYRAPVTFCGYLPEEEC